MQQPDDILTQAEIAALRGDWADVLTKLQQLSAAGAIADDRQLALALQGLSTGGFQTRWDLAKLVPSFGPAAIAPLTALLQTAADPEAQWFAVRILGQIPHADLVATLINVLATATDAELQGMTITILANLGDEAIVTLGNLLQHPTQRPLVAQALAQMRQPATIPWLLTVVNDEQAAVRGSAIGALGNFIDLRSLPALLHALTDRVAAVRCAAVTALGFWATNGPPDIEAQLQPLLWDVDLNVSQQTAIALSRWGNASAVTALADRLAAPDLPEPLGLDIVRALGWMNQAHALQPLRRAAQSARSQPLYQEIVMILGRVEPDLQPEATQILLDLINHPSAQITSAQPAIALALGQLGQSSALEPLMQLLATPDASLRLHVIAALKLLNAAIAYSQLIQLAQAETTAPDLQQGIAIALQEW